MRWRLFGDVPSPFDPAWLKKLLLTLAQSVNFLDEENFPNALAGDSLIKGTSLSGSALKAHTVPWGALTPSTVYVPLVLCDPATTTTSTTAVGVGPWFHWDPTQWPAGTWTLEVSLYASAGTANADLYGTAEVVGSAVSTTATNIARVVSASLTMPATATDLYLRLWSSVGTSTASCKGARLVLVVT